MSLTFLCCLLVVASFKATATKVYVQELSSRNFNVCHDKRKYSCPDSNSSLELRIMSCGFQCAPGTSYVCKDVVIGRGVLEFCAKPEICEIGEMNGVYFDEIHQKIVIEKSICPDGFYQPVSDDCYKACTEFKHEDADLVAHWGIKVLYPGNNTHPGRGYCDVDNGFVSSDTSKMYTSLGHNEVSICDKLDDFETLRHCPADKRLLPDGNCGDICGKGFVVDIWNNFKCSKHSGDVSTTVILKTTAHSYYIDVTPSPTGISTKQRHITTKVMQSTSPSHTDAHLLRIGLIILGCVVTFLFFAVICFIVWYVWKKKEPKIVKNNTKKNSGCSYSKIEAKSVNIQNVYMNGQKEADCDRSRRTNDTTNRSEHLSDMEQDCTSLGSGYSSVNPGKPVIEQHMNELKSFNVGSDTAENIDETGVKTID